MGKILAFDYGARRTGIAITDELQIIASALTTLESKTIWTFLEDLLQKEDISCFVVGDPSGLDGKETDNTSRADKFSTDLQKKYPHIPVERIDESFSSKRAVQAMVQGGMKKKKRREKGNVDMVSAVIILQDWLGQR